MACFALSAAAAAAGPAADSKDYAVIDMADHILAEASTCRFDSSTISRLKQIAAAAAKRAGATTVEAQKIEAAARSDAATARTSHPNTSPGPGCAASLAMYRGLAAAY